VQDKPIVHIAEDEKFINTAFRTFEAAFPGQNRFIILKPAANPPLRYLDASLPLQFEIKTNGIINRLMHFCSPASVIVLHGLNKLKGELVLRSGEKEKFLGIPLGAELYNPSVAGGDFLGPDSRQLSEKLAMPTLTDYVKKVYRLIRYRNLPDFSHVDDMHKVFGAVRTYGVLSELSLRQWEEDGIIPAGAGHLFFTYYPVDLIIRDQTLKAEGSNILLGNSASATNNHLEAFSLLHQLDLKDKKIIAPLSYGSKTYAKAIEQRGRDLFGSRFQPLKSFLPMAEYNRVIGSCGTIIMNHYRSQAVGNIVASLYIGCRVYLNNTDAYKYFRSIGCHVSLIEDELHADNPELFEPLPSELAYKNREILRGELGLEKLVSSLQSAFRERFSLTDRSA
jgi:dTDP-N-acetylfucosamine:lipid II N-acetylfucosaminyltransferase